MSWMSLNTMSFKFSENMDNFFFIKLHSLILLVACWIYFTKFQNFHLWQVFEICNLNFVLFWLGMKGIQYESIVWVIMGMWWVDGWVSQNAGIIVALVEVMWKKFKNTIRTDN